MSLLLRVLLALALLVIVALVMESVATTMLTPGWVETADMRDWASMTFFLSVVAVILLFAIRVGFHRARSGPSGLRSRDWWVVAALSVIGTVGAAIASHWTIALPGLIPIAVAVVLARRRARLERLVLVEPDASDMPPRASFTAKQSSGPRSI